MDLVTGVTGQDGGYLAELLLQSGRRTIGLVLPGEKLPAWVLELQARGLGLAACDLREPGEFRQLLRELKPERVFHCAAVSVPQQAARNAQVSQQINITSVEVLCDWLRREAAEARVLTVSSSAVFGPAVEGPCDESFASQPEGEYAQQKARVRQLAVETRARGLFCACAIPFNHESPRRPDSFVLPKVCRAAASISLGRQQSLELGALSPSRDWGYAPEYVQAMQWMLDVPEPHELVLATGEAHSVQELVELAFSLGGLNWKEHVSSDAGLIRPGDAQLSVGNPRRAYVELGWEARTKFEALVRLVFEQLRSELAAAR
ncbi:GDP-mannose 4,6-dehydratase [bacterium]|nr:GDP-mannose 4,6-dehydratase [bacterium]